MLQRYEVVDPSLDTPIFWEVVSMLGWNPTDEVTRVMYARLGNSPFFDLRHLPQRVPVLGLVAAEVDVAVAIEDIPITPVPALFMMLLPPAQPALPPAALLAIEAGREPNNP